MTKQGGGVPEVQLEQEKEREEVLNYKDSMLSWLGNRKGLEDANSPLLPGFCDWKRRKKLLRLRVVTCRSKIPSNYEAHTP